MKLFRRQPTTTVPPDPRQRDDHDLEAKQQERWRQKINVINRLLQLTKPKSIGDVSTYGDGSVVIREGGGIPPCFVSLARYREYFEPFGYTVGLSCHTQELENSGCPSFDNPDFAAHYGHELAVSIMPARY